MKKIVGILFVLMFAMISVAEAKGGFSSGGGGARGGFSSAARPSVATAPQRSVTTTTTTVNRSYSSRVSPGMGYGGMGMGYHYSNGLMTGLIIGSMMHPHGTVMYNGYGSYSGNALLYPNGSVVDQSGRLVGSYVGGVFNPVMGGQIIAQQVPSDAMVQQVAQPQPIVVQNHTDPTAVFIVLCLMCFILILMLL